MKTDLGNIINPFMKSIIVFECFTFSFKSFKNKMGLKKIVFNKKIKIFQSKNDKSIRLELNLTAS